MSIPQHEPVIEREEEDDHDLLTFGEAGARLQEEMQALRRSIAELESRSGETEGVTEDLQKARARLEAVEVAAARNARQTINDDNFEKFFGYRGTARRNTT
ncbi:MAG: acyl-CoA synthase [Modestobacter sp.]|jgi:hypothetical protein|nr:acyl-CoA synthase [Modestobacter sp.]MCW2510755.1 acyl-CoA synthase [Modestobacter sp.]MCW2574592.1 acyl-CoA synthase [Modestobacter sp.]MCW2620114.1 acyl-CoA synthase [Modestobacter sp.]HEV7871227.1 hypothetical protein [Modestobacter sp.]